MARKSDNAAGITLLFIIGGLVWAWESGFIWVILGGLIVGGLLWTLGSAMGSPNDEVGKVQSKGSRKNSPDQRESISTAPRSSTQRKTVNLDANESYSIGAERARPIKCIFHPKAASVSVQGIEIGGLVYTGNVGEDSFYDEPAIINPKLKITESSLAQPLTYYPSYSQMTAMQRARYLRWLSNGRKGDEEPGHGFLLLYGFERYVHVDAPNTAAEARDVTLKEIVEETKRLQGVFGESQSFQDYSNDLLDAIYIRYWSERIDERKGSTPSRRGLAVGFKVIHQANTANDTPLDADWALQWLLSSGEVSRTRAVRDNYTVLRALFRHHYEQATKGGMKIPKSKRSAGTYWLPTSSYGLNDVAKHEFPDDWFSPLGLKRPLNTLQEIFKTVMPEVRKLAKALASKDPLEILNAWPADMPTRYSPQLDKFAARLKDLLGESETVVAANLADILNLETGDTLSIPLYRKMVSAVETCGYVLVPDPNITAGSVKSQDLLAAYAGKRLVELSPEGQRLATYIQLGAMVALADGDLHEHEIAILKQLVDSHSNSAEREYLCHYTTWRLNQKPSTAGLKAHIERLSPEVRLDLGRMLVDMARADGSLPKQEIRELEKLFGRLGLADDAVTQMLHQAAAFSSDNEEQAVSRPGQREESEAKSSGGTGVVIDYKKLQEHAASTLVAQGILATIFEDEDEPEEDRQAAPLVSDAWHEGRLDSAHDSLATWLLGAEEWPVSEVQAKCAELGLMVEGALAAINEAAFESLGDSLIEMNDPVEVYRDVLPA